MGLIVELLQNANRDSGDWLPQIHSCRTRVIPCGNPACADEAMHAAEIAVAHTNDAVAIFQIAQSLKNAHRFATRCPADAQECPLENATQLNRHIALLTLYNLQSETLTPARPVNS